MIAIHVYPLASLDCVGDVAACTAAGNIKATRDSNGNVDIANAEKELRNQTIGLGGNTAFLTTAFYVEGVAYRCP